MIRPDLQRRPRPTTVVALAILTTATLTACRGEPAGPPSSSPSSATPSPTDNRVDPTAAAAHDAAEAYVGMWRAYTEAGRTTNPQYTELSRYADGDALAALKVGLDANKRQGLVTKGDLVPHPVVTKLSPASAPDTASIRDCLDTSGATRVKASPGGSPFQDTPGGRRQVTATVKDLGGTWKVASFVPLDVGTC